MTGPSLAQDQLFIASYLGNVARHMTSEACLRGFDLFALRYDTERVVAMSSPATLKGALALPVLMAHRLILEAMKMQPEISEPPMKSALELYQDSLIAFLDKAPLEPTHDCASLYTDVLQKAFNIKRTTALAHRLLRYAPTQPRASSFLAHEMNRCFQAESIEDRKLMFQIAPTPQALAPMALSPVIHAQVALHYGALASDFLKVGQGLEFCAAVRAMRAFAVIGLNMRHSDDRDNLLGLARQADICLMQRYVNPADESLTALPEQAEGLRLLLELNDLVYSRAAADKAKGLFGFNDLKSAACPELLDLAVTGMQIYPTDEMFYRGLLRLAEGFVQVGKPDKALFALDMALRSQVAQGTSEAAAIRDVISNPINASADVPLALGILSAAQFNQLARREGVMPRSHRISGSSLKIPAC